ncbi:hypothetical protein J416_00224 [Gracilibacillus halophilus YIM-C55.5]|uniref:Uncharacterized protein n=1 Tax=Gracilibacillus halophilus YIM-C55.5 TaxID=1308866 RepID=N4WDM1_9BACI|nr:hypothetical protein [Gracilibacillus halophilus]ENH98368.1 hypothetical protein J416_00224 [Gracilibacillus halophilus YIM-C55.5]
MKRLWQTLRTMTFTEALDYIWEYYKVHLFGIAIGLFISISIVSSVFGKDPVQYHVMVVGQVTYEQSEAFSNEINDEYFSDFEIAVDSILHDGGEWSNQSYGQVQKFTARSATGMIDLLVTDKGFANMILEQEGLRPMEDVIDVEQFSEEATHQLGTDDVYAVNADQFHVFRDSEALKDKVVAVMYNSEQSNLTDDVLQTLRMDQ